MFMVYAFFYIVYCLYIIVYGLRFMVCYLCFTVYGLLFMIYHFWLNVHGLCFILYSLPFILYFYSLRSRIFRPRRVGSGPPSDPNWCLQSEGGVLFLAVRRLRIWSGSYISIRTEPVTSFQSSVHFNQIASCLLTMFQMLERVVNQKFHVCGFH